jgi:hypothetical protein
MEQTNFTVVCALDGTKIGTLRIKKEISEKLKDHLIEDIEQLKWVIEMIEIDMKKGNIPNRLPFYVVKLC